MVVKQASHLIVVVLLLSATTLSGCTTTKNETPSANQVPQQDKICSEWTYYPTEQGWSETFAPAEIPWSFNTFTLGLPIELAFPDGTERNVTFVQGEIYVRSKSGVESQVDRESTVWFSDPSVPFFFLPHELQPGQIYGSLTNLTGNAKIVGLNPTYVSTSYVISPELGTDLSLISTEEHVSRLFLKNCGA